MLKPLNNKIQLDIEEVKIGAIQSEAVEEYAKIVAVGQNVDAEKFPIGATLYFKAWAIDVITKDEKKLYFISSDNDAICAIG